MSRPFQDCVLLLGDSLTQGQEVHGNLYERMNLAYVRKLDVLNRGFGGYNTKGLLVLMDEMLAKKEHAATSPVIRMVTIWLGANDAILPTEPGAVPLNEFTSNLNAMLVALTSASSPYAAADTPLSIILITPGPCWPGMFEPDTGRDEWCIPENMKMYRDAVLKVGAEWKMKEEADPRSPKWMIETVDAWGDLVNAAGGEGEGLRPYFTDGIHFSSKGYSVLWEGIAKVIQTKFAGRGLDWEVERDLPKRVPASEDVDWKRPQSVIEGMKLPKFRLA